MKNKILIIIATILIIIGILILIKERPYTIKDRDRALDIYLENKKPNVIDYMRLDMNKDHKIDLVDVMTINKKVNE